MRKNIRFRSTVAIAAMLLTLAVSTSGWAESKPMPIKAPVITETTNPDGSVTVRGVVEFRELEGGFYAVGGWSLMGDPELFAKHLGQEVMVRGKIFDGVSIRMTKSIEVIEIASETEASIISDGGNLPGPVADANGRLTLEGEVKFNDLEGGFYSVDGIGLMGDEKLFKALVGMRVLVRGTEFGGISIRMVRQVEVESISQTVATTRSLPEAVTFNGKPVTFDQKPVVIDGVLMLPLRAVAEAAGGKVEWDAKERAVIIAMPDRMAWFKIGEHEAEMNEKNVRYIQRNMIAMQKAPVIRGDRTLVSADAVTRILGLSERVDGDANLDLVPPHSAGY